MSMVKKKLQKRFKMTDMGPASLVEGMEIKRDCEQGTLTISQEAYSSQSSRGSEGRTASRSARLATVRNSPTTNQRTLCWTRRKRDVIRASWGA